MFEQLLVQFGDVEQFLREAKAAKLTPQIVPQIWETLSDQESRINLQLQLAAIVDVGDHFVTATYYLEGGGPLVFSCYEKLQAVAEACRVPHFPNVRAVSTAMATESPPQNVAALEQRARACVDQAIQRFLQKFNARCMIWSQHSRLHGSCAPWQCSGCDLRQPPCRLSASSPS